MSEALPATFAPHFLGLFVENVNGGNDRFRAFVPPLRRRRLRRYGDFDN
jgi:hypothetical protein